MSADRNRRRTPLEVRAAAAAAAGDEPVEVGVRSTGMVQHVDGSRVQRAAAAFEKDVQYALKSESHLWIMMLAHRLSDAAVRRLAAGSANDEPLDVESLVVSGVGCYVCEEPMTKRLLDRRCPGEPK